MLQSTLQNLANKLYRKYFHHTLSCKVCFNSRLRTTAGRFTRLFNRRTHKDVCYYIEINPHVIGFSKSEPENTIKHELIHLYLYKNHVPYGHNATFSLLAKKLHCDVYMPANFGRSPHTTYHIYQCQSCGSVILRKRRMNTKAYVCSNKVKNNLGMSVSCNGQFKSCGTITVAQLHKKNNKVHRLKVNFKHKQAVIHKYSAKFNHVLGYTDSFARMVTQRASIQGKIINNELGKLLPKFSHHAQVQFIHELNDENVYTPVQAIKKMHTYRIDKRSIVYDYTQKSIPKVTRQISRLHDTFVSLLLDDEAGTGWFLSSIDDDMFLSAMACFADDNYTNGIKLLKMMIDYMSKHNQDYKKIEAKQNQMANA